VRGEDAVGWVERFPGYRALLVRRDGTVVGSAGFGLHPLAPPAVAVSGR
jgi:hypothetical protein